MKWKVVEIEKRVMRVLKVLDLEWFCVHVGFEMKNE